MKEYRIEERINKNEETNEILYISGLVDVISFLMSELKSFLEKEKRYFGLAKSYMNSIDGALGRAYEKIGESDIEVFEKILYVFKPLIIIEFNRLKQKGLSSGDSVICLTRKLLEIILEYQEDHPLEKEIKTLKKLIDRYYDNIRNKAKLDNLYNYSNNIRLGIENQWVGKYGAYSLNLDPSIRPKEEFTGDNIKLEEQDNTITEITWIGEQ